MWIVLAVVVLAGTAVSSAEGGGSKLPKRPLVRVGAQAVRSHVNLYCHGQGDGFGCDDEHGTIALGSTRRALRARAHARVSIGFHSRVEGGSDCRGKMRFHPDRGSHRRAWFFRMPSPDEDGPRRCHVDFDANYAEGQAIDDFLIGVFSISTRARAR